MEFELSVPQVNSLLSAIDRETSLAQRLSAHGLTNGRILIPDHFFNADALEKLWQLAEKDGDSAIMFQIIALRNIRTKPGHDLVVPQIEMLTQALTNYFAEDAIDGWIYSRNKDGALLPWLIERIEFKQREDGSLQGMPYVQINLIANTIATADAGSDKSADRWRSGMTNSILFYQREMNGMPIPELLARKGFFKECPEFKAEYEKQAARFQEFQPLYGKQFVATHSGFMAKKNGANKPSSLEFFRISPGALVKCINDEEIIERRIETHISKRTSFGTRLLKIPLHCYLHLFHLELHQNCWIHIQNIQEYRYKPELKTKLVLPAEHRKLVDILTSHMDVLMDDIIEGKSGGTTILCMGAAGLGKTLTAEIYSEVVGKPLYRVHSGHLGTSAESVQSSLSEILQRASRWDAILLLDEADVYIRKRGNELQHNAIVAEFLRTLEYFDGLLFMTTNRVDDVDDAIMSRCIAVIRYESPSREDAIKLWQTLSEQFKVTLSDELIHQLVRDFPNSSGRDIKEMLKLTSRLCSSCGEPVSIEAFHHCAVYRGRR